MKNVGYFLAFLVLTACSGEEKRERTTRADSVHVPEKNQQPERAKPVPEKPLANQTVRNQSVKWQYEKKVNPEGQTVFKASINSPAVLQFGFPYTGGSTVALTIRQRDRQVTAYLQVSNGQFNRSFQGGSMRIRFDGKSARTYSYSAAENGSATVIFIDDADALIRQLKAAGKTFVDVAFYGQGTRQIEFLTAGLVWNH